MALTQEQIDLASDVICIPLTIILNYSLFQYLLTVFYARRRDPHVRLLLVASFLGFATLIPFVYPNDHLVQNLNDMSEVCSVLTFTQQIAILTRDINKKMKLPTVSMLGKVAEILVFLGIMLLLANIVSIVAPEAESMDAVELLDIGVEYAALLFVVCFRFYFLSIVRGWKHVWQHQKLEVFYYALFLTHAAPFQLAARITDLDWHHIQGLWLRITIALCLSSSIRAKIISMSSRNGSKSTRHGGSDRNLKVNKQLQRSSVVPSGSRMEWSQSEHTMADGLNKNRRKSSTTGPKADATLIADETKQSPTLVASLTAGRRHLSKPIGSTPITGFPRTGSSRLMSSTKALRSVAPTQ